MNVTINDLMYFSLQALLIILAVYSLYAQYGKSRINNSWASTKRAIKKKRSELKAKLEARKINKQNIRNKKQGKNIQLVVADSVMSLEMLGKANIQVIRGERDWEYFALAWTVLSVFIIESNSLYNSPVTENFSIAVMILDIFIVTYLCFLSAWFRNKVIAIVVWRNTTPD